MKDVAALVKQYPEEMRRTIGTGKKKTTVKSSLKAALAPAAVGYLMNIGRFLARNPDVATLHGTTHNEAYHKELKSFLRNVMRQTRRHAQMIAGVATFVKLVSSVMNTAHCVVRYEQVDLLNAFNQTLLANGLPVSGRIVHASTYNILKRPAAA